MKTIFYSLAAVTMLIVGYWQQSDTQQNEAKAKIRKQHRDARYHSDTSNVKKLKDGQKQVSFVDFVDMTGYDPKASASKRDTVRDKLETEHKEKRKTIGCTADMIVFGKIGQPTGYVTTDESYIYTSYPLTITEIIKAPQSVLLKAGDEIEVTIPGGKAKTSDGKGIIEVQDPSFTPLIPLQNHILLLKYDKEADDYYVFDPIGIYKLLGDGHVIRGDAMHFELAKEAHLAREPNTFDAIMADLKSLDCSKK
jgi:hypothetical protein